jgi:hypothetical protein
MFDFVLNLVLYGMHTMGHMFPPIA